MDIPTQRNAIEVLLGLYSSSHHDLRRFKDSHIEFDGERLIFLGVSEGIGPQSRSTAKVAIFAIAQTDEAVSKPFPPVICQGAVLLRAPTQKERASWGPNTALHAIDAIGFTRDEDGALQAIRGELGVTYVPL